MTFLTTYQNAVNALHRDSKGELEGDVWIALGKQLPAAHGQYKIAPNLVRTDHGSIAVNREQWVKTDGSDTWAKRGENTWPAVETARQRIGPLPAGGGALVAHHDFTVPTDVVGSVVTIRIGYTAASLVHFCNRHTYRHFANAQIKLLNTFFAAGTDQAAVIGHAQNAFALRRRVADGVEPAVTARFARRPTPASLITTSCG